MKITQSFLSFCLMMMMSLAFWQVEAQTPTSRITGTVKDQLGEALIGVNVVEKGTTNGTITDLDGNYSLIPTKNNTALMFSYVGFLEQTIPLSNRKVINVTLKEDTQALEEVVVIGYGTAKKKDLTGAISTIKTANLQSEAPQSVQDLMRANTPGLNISMASNAKGNTDLQVRGNNTLKAGSSPLLVLDGVIYEGSLSDINPMDIASIDVLKDASSAAVYGAKAANGVVVINTKKGKAGKPLVNFNTNIGFVQGANTPDILDGDEFMQFRQDYEIGKSSDAYLAQYPEMFINPNKLQNVDKLAWYNYDQKTPVTSATDEDMMRTWASRLDLKAPIIENFIAGNETDWKDKVFQTGLQQDYTVSLSNRTDNMSYYWSLGYTNREGVVVGDAYETYRSRLNLESKVTSFLKVGLNTSFASRDDGALSCAWNSMYRVNPYASDNRNDPTSIYQRYPSGDVSSTNPFYDNDYRTREDKTNTLNASIYAVLTLPFGIEYQVNFTPHYTWRQYLNHQSSKSDEWASKGGESWRENYKTYNWQLDNVFRWKKTFNKKHKVEATFLINSEKNQYWYTQAHATVFSPSDALGYHNIGAGTVPTVSSDDTYSTGDALMGRLFYSFSNKYMITASARRDGYSAFGQKNPRATFPSVAVGWTFTEEKFMEPTQSWLDYGKVRLSWGQNGNRDIGIYDALSNLNSGFYPYVNQSGSIYVASQLYVNRMANENLKWERTASTNLGLDYSFFNNRISGSIDGYISTTNDLLVDRALPDVTGFDNVAANLGQLQNKGLELSVNFKAIEKENFRWNTTGSLSLNRREIVELYGDMEDVFDAEGNPTGAQREVDDPDNGWFIGQDPDRIWSYEGDGVWQMDEAAEAEKYGNRPGDFKYIDQNGDGVMTDADKTFQGYTTPRFRWMWRNEFTFHKDFTFSCMMYSNIGQYRQYGIATNSYTYPDRSSAYDLPRWTPDNPINDYARVESKNIGTHYINSSFIRLDNIAFSYNLPKSILSKIKVQNMRLSLSVRNVAVFSPKWDFFDPESTEYWGSTSPRTFNLGVNFTL
ncbi:MAG: TonB-dependent receptor [Massilibacteroides sp.]|nr:TonB-dependent receptor [Massilibacteroides sp.]